MPESYETGKPVLFNTSNQEDLVQDMYVPDQSGRWIFFMRNRKFLNRGEQIKVGMGKGHQKNLVLKIQIRIGKF